MREDVVTSDIYTDLLLFSGMDYYVKNFGGTYHDAFYTNTKMIDSFKEYISHVLNRENSLTGVKYKVLNK